LSPPEPHPSLRIDAAHLHDRFHSVDVGLVNDWVEQSYADHQDETEEGHELVVGRNDVKNVAPSPLHICAPAKDSDNCH